jgi:hypothetical protein
LLIGLSCCCAAEWKTFKKQLYKKLGGDLDALDAKLASQKKLKAFLEWDGKSDLLPLLKGAGVTDLGQLGSSSDDELVKVMRKAGPASPTDAQRLREHLLLCGRIDALPGVAG